METAASIIAILQLSEKVIQYVRDVSGATEERRRLREQVRACSNILLLLRDGVEDSDEGQAWAETVDMLASPLERLRRALELAAIRLHAKSSTKEKLKWPFKEKEVQKLIEAIESEKGLLTLAFENNSARLLQQIDIRSKNNSTHLEELTALMSTHAINSEGHLQDLKSAVSKLQDTHISLHEDMSALEEAEKIRELAAKRVKIIDWLSPLDHTSQQHDIISKRQVGTGDWFLRSNQYQQWLKNKGGLLFCPGIPGAGKTILTSIAVADLRERYHRDARVATVFYYIDFRRQQTIDNIFLSLLKQLVEGRTELSKSVANYYDQHHERGTRPILDDAVTAFCNELRLYSRVFVVIDALDESQAGADLVSTVLDVQKDGRFNLLATSRSLPEISTQFADAAVLEIRASHQDVRTYLEAHIRQLPGFVKTNVKLQEEIKASIVRLVQGM
jgi:phage gp46-like protein